MYKAFFLALMSLNSLNLSAESSTINFDVSLKLTGFNREQEEKVLAAVELLKKIIISEEFKQRVLAKNYKGEKIYVDNLGLSNEQVYQRILEGEETLGLDGKNRTMDLDLEVYYEDTKTIGYTYPNIKRIYVNKKYLDKFLPHQVSDNLMHEWLHKLGFDHEVERTKSRSHSIPYSVGNIVKELAQSYK